MKGRRRPKGNKMNPTYLDYNATTPIDPLVVDALLPWLTEGFGNPSSNHPYGRKAKQAVELARADVARLLGADSSEIVFTSGGTESNNQALIGVALANNNRGRHIITSAIEHPAVLNPLHWLEGQGFTVTYLPVDGTGKIDPEAVRQAVTAETILISVMHANNEVGTIQPLAEISAVARKHGIPLHSDAAQSVGKIPTRVDDLGVDLMTVAGHKLYAPKGIGALYVRSGVSINSYLHGAGHEAGRRAGTENVPYIVALGKALQLAGERLPGEEERILRLRDQFHTILRDLVDGVQLNGHPIDRLPNTLNVSFNGVIGTDLLGQTPEIAASTGSACHDGNGELSGVLKAMGIPRDQGFGAVRFSLGRLSSIDEIERAATIVATKVKELRSTRGGDANKHILDLCRYSGGSIQSKVHWENVYTTKKTDEVSWFQEHAEQSLKIILSCDLSKNAAIIDVGGGASVLADDLVENGYSSLTVLDVSGAALSKTKERLGDKSHAITWLEADITKVELEDGAYNVWHDRAAFHFLTSEEDRIIYVQKVMGSVKKGGHVIIATFAEDGPTQCSGLPVCRYSAIELHAQFGGKFLLIETAKDEHHTPSNAVQKFMYCHFQKM